MRHIVRWSNPCRDLVWDEARHGCCFADPLRVKPLLDSHIQEIRVPSKIQLIALINTDPPFQAEIDQGPVNDRRTDLALYIVPCNGQFLLLKLMSPAIR